LRGESIGGGDLKPSGLIDTGETPQLTKDQVDQQTAKASGGRGESPLIGEQDNHGVKNGEDVASAMWRQTYQQLQRMPHQVENLPRQDTRMLKLRQYLQHAPGYALLFNDMRGQCSPVASTSEKV